MTDENKGTTVYLDFDMIAEADAIALALMPLYGGKTPKRVAVVRRALHDLFLRVCPTDSNIGLPVDEAA